MKEVNDVDKWTYLRWAIKDAPAQNVNEGLSQTAKNYEEAIKCLLEHYDQPRLIHQAQVHAILEAPFIKDGSTKELRRLYYTLNQHICALKAMKYNCFNMLITAAAELKFNQSAMRE